MFIFDKHIGCDWHRDLDTVTPDDSAGMVFEKHFLFHVTNVLSFTTLSLSQICQIPNVFHMYTVAIGIIYKKEIRITDPPFGIPEKKLVQRQYH